MNLKDLSEKVRKGELNKPKTSSEEKYDVLFDTLMEGSLHYLFGCFDTYTILHGKDRIMPNELIEELKKIPKNIETDDERKKYLKENKTDINEFLYWFFYEKN